jgi:hypothetical protein
MILVYDFQLKINPRTQKKRKNENPHFIKFLQKDKRIKRLIFKIKKHTSKLSKETEE